MKKCTILIIMLLSAFAAFSQTAIGSFQAHAAMHSFSTVAVDATTVYAATDNGLMLLEKSSISEGNPETSSWTKVDGLSDIDIVKIFFSKEHNALIIFYINGNIDVIKNDQIVNIRDVKDKSLTGSKHLQVCRELDGRMYLVYPFGIVILDLGDMVITDTWFTKRENTQFTPTDITLGGQRFYISTTEGVFSVAENSPVINDFSQWDRISSQNVSFLSAVADRVFAVKVADEYDPDAQDSLLLFTGNNWENTGKYYKSIRYMSSQHDTLLLCYWDAVELLNPQAERLFLASWYEDWGTPNNMEAVLDGDNIWVADRVFGLVQNNMTYFFHRFFTNSGPFADYVESITSCNGVVAVTHGSRKGSSSYAPGYKYPAISWLQNGEWQFRSAEFLTFDPNQNTYDLNRVAVNPKDETEWAVASWGNGVFKCRDQMPVSHYNAANSGLDSASSGKTLVSALQYDAKGNLWMTNSSCPNMLKMLEPNGTWHSYNVTSGVLSSSYDGIVAEHLLIDSRGYKWVNFPRAGVRYNLIAFTDNGTYDNKGDDRLARIDMNAAAEVNSSTVYCMAEDLDGEIWIGTDKGVKVIYYPSKVFNGGVYPRNILLEQDGYVSVLLEFEEVTAIAVDGANRKWIGTNKAGVFLMSENGQEQLQHFTAEDHPLFSNQIVDINVNQFTGEVFFATSKGLVSYKGTATGGFETYEDLPVYPNPVPHGYTGAVAVNGLKSNSLCKITDSSGKLVWQGYSDGGQLVWYCKDHHGNRPATGVYYVMASDETGKERMVTKFVFIN